MAEQRCRVVVLPAHRGCRSGGGVASQDAFEEIGGGEGVDMVGAHHVVHVAVADDLEVKVVFHAATGGCGVCQLAAFLAGEQSVAGVGGQSLSGGDGGGVAELDSGSHVVGREV